MRAACLCALIAVGFGCGRVTPPTVATPAPTVATHPAPTGERVEHPSYTRWARHAPGTTVVVRETTTHPGYTTQTTTTYRLKSVTSEVSVVEVAGAIKAPDGTVINNPPQDLRYDRWAYVTDGKAKEALGRPAGTVEATPEAVALLGKQYQATRYRSKGHVEAGETETLTWLADEVPGGLVKAVYSVPAGKKTVSSEVIEIRIP
jgi:hypothetical protein